MAQAAVKKIDVRPACTPRASGGALWTFPTSFIAETPTGIAAALSKGHPQHKEPPFLQDVRCGCFLPIGEIKSSVEFMAILNNAHNEFHQERAGFFGFFEVENDQQATAALLDAARDWLRSRGAVVIRGPVNPSTNYECALLVDGFDLDPMVMMTYNPPFYAQLLETYGMKKAMDLYAYDIAADYFNRSNKLQRVADGSGRRAT